MNNIILAKGKKKILECFYKNRDQELYFSEILRLTKLTPNTTLKHLRILESNKILISNKKIANTFYKINNKNPLIYSIFSHFDYILLNQLLNPRRRAIIDFIEQIKVKPLIILVFGSTAKKTYTSESDIDILLIYNKKELKNNKVRLNIEAITGSNIQEFIISYDYFKEQVLKGEDSVITHAIKTGFIVLGHYYFYKEVLG
jgi:predicted nucleotidyltransferase/DNA-binding transcriptional ArsR family regulator